MKKKTALASAAAAARNGISDYKRSGVANAKTWSDASVHHTFVGNEAFYGFA